jgi:hypothetical protein
LVFECKNLSAAEIHLLVRVDGNKVRSQQTVAKWCANFKTRRISTEDCERSSSPTTASTVTPIPVRKKRGRPYCDRSIIVSIAGQQRLAFQRSISLSPFHWNMEINPVSGTM